MPVNAHLRRICKVQHRDEAIRIHHIHTCPRQADIESNKVQSPGKGMQPTTNIANSARRDVIDAVKSEILETSTVWNTSSSNLLFILSPLVSYDS
eukprot:5793501-Amphidinium_carterae.1